MKPCNLSTIRKKSARNQAPRSGPKIKIEDKTYEETEEMLESVEALAEAKETVVIGLVSTQNINGYNVLTLAS